MSVEDLILQSEAQTARLDDIPVAVLGVRGGIILTPDGELQEFDLDSMKSRLTRSPHLMIGRSQLARRLGLYDLPAYDLLELFAFTRPSRPCLPNLKGILSALTMPAANSVDLTDLEDQALLLPKIAERLLADLASQTYAYRAGSMSVAVMMARAGWRWAPLVAGHLDSGRDDSREDGLKPWVNLQDFDDDGPPPKPDDLPILPDDARTRLSEILGDDAEVREGQRRFASAATHAFRPKELEDMPNIQVLEAGTGTGKTLGYIAPASLWAEKNDGPVWLSTYTKNLQRQLDQELSKLYPDPRVKAKKAVIRKGRENYACLLNIEDTMRAVLGRPPVQGGVEDRDQILMGLVARWARFSRDGDMIGGDFPSWLGTYFGFGRLNGLTDRRGECLHAGCAHYRKCYIEKAVRKSKQADLVVANHALVMINAFVRRGDPDLPKRLVFDEGHHVFDAADSCFSVQLSGLEGADLRRWLRGKETGSSTRARGIKARLEEILEDETALDLLRHVVEQARCLPGEGWNSRVVGDAPLTAYERFLASVRQQVVTRSDDKGFYGQEAPANDPVDGLVDAAGDLSEKLLALETPMTGLSKRLVSILEDDADIIESSNRTRIESAAKSLELRSEMLSTWRAMLLSLQDGTPEGFIDWFEIDRAEGRERDFAFYRYHLDPTKPLVNQVYSAAHGIVLTSATLRDRGANTAMSNGQSDWAAANMAMKNQADLQTATHTPAQNSPQIPPQWRAADNRLGTKFMRPATKRLVVESPFDYASNTKFIVVNDVNKTSLEQVSGAFKALFSASGGGALGLFTAINRLRKVYEKLAPVLEERHIPLYSQHIDPIDTPTLVDIFRSEVDSCLLGTDAVRDGVDVPGDSLRLLVFDRVPWPRPTILHKARRDIFGRNFYDDMLTRLKLTQAFGRLVRRAGDRGVFVILDGQTPSRLLAGLPDGVPVQRMGLAEACKEVKNFINDKAT